MHVSTAVRSLYLPTNLCTGNKTQHPVTSLKPRVLVLRTTCRESHQEEIDKERNRDRRTNTSTDTTDRRRTHEHNKTHRKRTLPNPPSTRSAKSEQHGPIIVVNYFERPSPQRRRWGLCGKGGFRMDRQSPRGGVPRRGPTGQPRPTGEGTKRPHKPSTTKRHRGARLLFCVSLFYSLTANVRRRWPSLPDVHVARSNS